MKPITEIEKIIKQGKKDNIIAIAIIICTFVIAIYFYP